MYKEELALNNLQVLIWHKIQPASESYLPFLKYRVKVNGNDLVLLQNDSYGKNIDT